MSYPQAGEYLHRAIEQGLVTLEPERVINRFDFHDTLPINPCREIELGERRSAQVGPSFQEFHLMEEVEEL